MWLYKHAMFAQFMLAQIKVFCEHQPVHLTIHYGVEVSMIRTFFCQVHRCIYQKNHFTSRRSYPFCLKREDHSFHLDALKVEVLVKEVLVDMPFVKTSDIGIRPSKNQVRIGDSLTIQYKPGDGISQSTHVQRAQALILSSEHLPTVLWPGAYLELNILKVLHPESTLVMEPRINGSTTPNCPKTEMIEAIGGKVRIVNRTGEPQFIGKNNHLC